MNKLITIFITFLLVASVAAASSSKRELAKAVLIELGVAHRFDTYLTRGADQLIGGGSLQTKHHRWLQNLWIQELGWSMTEDAYVSHFEAKFTSDELSELLELAKKPLIRKLVQQELEAFRVTFDERNRIFARFWQRYNSLEFSPPR